MIPTTTRSETRAETGYRTTKQKEKQPAPPHRATKILQYILHANFEQNHETNFREANFLPEIYYIYDSFFFFFFYNFKNWSIDKVQEKNERNTASE